MASCPKCGKGKLNNRRCPHCGPLPENVKLNAITEKVSKS